VFARKGSDQLSTGRSGSEPSQPSAAPLTIEKKSWSPGLSTWISKGRGGVVKRRFDFAQPRAQVLRHTSLVERASQVGYLGRRHDVADVLDSRPGAGEAALDALRRQVDDFDQLDRAAVAGAEGGVVDELGRLTAREDVFQRHVLDQQERAGAELVDQSLHGRLDVVDDVGVMVRLAEPRSEQVLRQGSLLSSRHAAAVVQVRPLTLHVVDEVLDVRLEVPIGCR